MSIRRYRLEWSRDGFFTPRSQSNAKHRWVPPSNAIAAPLGRALRSLGELGRLGVSDTSPLRALRDLGVKRIGTDRSLKSNPGSSAVK